MLKKGFRLFTTSPAALERKIAQDPEFDPKCCKVCCTPCLGFFLFLCKHREATLFEFIRDSLSKGSDRYDGS